MKMAPKHRMFSLLFVICLSCFERPLFADNASNEVINYHDIDIVQELEKCPYWVNTSPGEINIRNRITESYRLLNHIGTDKLRNGIVSYLDKHGKNDPGMDDAQLKVFALLRVIFKLPKWVPLATADFDIAGNPIEGGRVNLLWPYEEDSEGGLHLTGKGTIVIAGRPMNPLRDFDNMAVRYGRRS